ncbi:pol polyprotein, partial [Pseudoloma neurophilia]
LTAVLQSKSRTFPVECGIPTADNIIVSLNRRYCNMRERDEFVDLVSKLEKEGKLEPSASNWCNPVRLTRKDSGKLRFTLDLGRLNDMVELDEFGIPNVSETIRHLHNQEYFSIIDLKDGYFQVTIKIEDREKTTFMTPDNRLLQFTRMPQGFKNSPATFQRGMTIILHDLIGKVCYVYLDDILIFGRNEWQHDQNLKLVISRLKMYQLELNDQTSVLKQKQVNFLGFNISKHEIRPKPDRAQGIQDFKRPETKKGLQSFLGLINYDREFVPHLAEKIKPLYNLLSQDGKMIEWDEQSSKILYETKSLWADQLN